MTEDNVNPSEETQDETETEVAPQEASAETTDAPDGVADVENVPEEAAPDEADEPGTGADPPAAEPATAEPEDVPDAVGDEPAAAEAVEEMPAAEADEVVEEEAVADEASAASDGAEPSEPAAAAVSEPKKKKKRLPRALRPQRTKTKRERSAERKAITRLPKPEHARGRRQERQGKVVSAASDKTIVVRVDTVKVHPMYKKVIRRSTKLHAHDAENQAKIGDVVRIVETRPISKQKRWRLQEVVEAAK